MVVIVAKMIDLGVAMFFDALEGDDMRGFGL